ncbi:ABC transporter substrate-binding protein [Symmachiella dynata]|uniref:ABC transporter substrate-binding protein n=1 Tax=Symmachiella dynata TaxID=2527995 RepID=UPI0030EEAB86
MTESDSARERDVTATGILREFQDDWEAGLRPNLEDYASRAPEDVRQEVLAELINADLRRRRSLGENPSPTDYIQRFPADQPTISAAFSAIDDTIVTEGSKREPDLGSTEVDIAVGEMLGKYEIRSVLGIGGMGVVFGAYDTVIRREVAIKLLSSKHSTNENALSRLLQEAQTAGAMHHPNIVGIYDVLEVEGAYYVVMEKVPGDDLSEVLKKSTRGFLDWKLATRIAMDCCDALTAAHAQGLIHRDIKPQNIMLTVESTVKLLDFGLAKSDQDSEKALTQHGTILGTPDFMSPEQCSAREINSLSDIYSLGATYYDLLTGHAPFTESGTQLQVMFAHCNQPVPSVVEERPELPAGCDRIIQRAMAKRPEDRYQSAVEMRKDLAALLSEEEPPPPVAAPAVTAAKPFPWKIAAGGAVVVAALVIFFALSGLFNDRSNDGLQTENGNAVAGKANQNVPTFRGVTADTIHLGTTTAFNGPNEELGRNMVIGMKSYFDSVNDAGGVHGRRIELTVLDDRYDPDKALENMKQLFEDRKVFAVIGNVGTPTANVTSVFASKNGHLFFAPLTGASLLREDPPDRYIFNYRASYQDETAALVKYFVESLQISPEQIAVFAQNDAFGDDGFAGVARAVKARGIEVDQLLRVGYDRNQFNIDEAVSTIVDDKNDIRAIVMVSTYKVAARFVKRVKAVKPDMVFGAVSFVGSRAFAEEFRENGPADGEGVIVTQVVPPFMSNATGVLEYRRLLQKYNPEYEPGFVSLEGFIAARIFTEGLRLAGPDLNTETLIDALHRINDLDIGIGPMLTFSPSRHQASHQVWGTRLTKEGEFESFDLE